MKAGQLIAAAIGVAVLAGSFGCSSDSNPTSPNSNVTQQEADDVATQSVVAIDIFGDDFANAAISTPAAPSPGPARAARAQWDTSFVSGIGLSYQASRTFFDAADNQLPYYGPNAVRMRWNSHASGLLVTARDSATVGHGVVLDVRGIQSAADTLQLDGTSSDSLLNKFVSYDGLRTRIYNWRSVFNLVNVRFPKSQLATGPRPIGTLTMAISVDRLRTYNRLDVESHFDVTVVVILNGSDTAVLVVDGRYTYSWNVATGSVTRLP